MKKKEIKELAKKIAKEELALINSKNKEEILKHQERIMSLSKSMHSIEDMMAVDEEVQNILSKK